MFMYVIVTWEVLSIPPMSGIILTPKSALTVKVHSGSTSLLYTWRLLSEDAATQIPSYTDGEGGINCTVANKHSMGWKEGKRISGQSGGT